MKTNPVWFSFFADQTRLGHWILDGDMSHSHLLRFALKESNFRDTTLLLCVAMTSPWNIMDQLQVSSLKKPLFPLLTPDTKTLIGLGRKSMTPFARQS